jgi:hypothetical protein
LLVEDSANPDSSPFVVTAAGDVGIGTSSPGAKLDVSGANAGTVLASRILNTSTSASSDAQQFIYVNGASAGDPYITWTVGGVASWSAGIRNSDSDNWYLSPGGSLATSPAVTVTTSGNLGLGVTPSAWDTTNSVRALQLTQGAVWGYSAANMYLAANNYWNGTNRIYLSNNTAGEYRITGNVHAWMQAPSGTANTAITFTQAMTLDASGNLYLGVTSAAAGRLAIKDVSGSGNNVWLIGRSSDGTSSVSFRNNADTAYNARIECFDTGVMTFCTGTSATERARITSGGVFQVDSAVSSATALSTTNPFRIYTGTSTFTDTGAAGTRTHGTIVAFDNPAIAATNATVTYTNASTVYIDGAPTAGSNAAITNAYALYVNAGNVSAAGVYTATVGGTNRDVYVDSTGLIGYVSSTRASKTNITNITDANWLLQLNPVSFNYRKKDEAGNYTEEADGPIEFGLIAEDTEAIKPELCFYDDVDGKQELRGISYSKLITPMLKLLQEQQTLITSLTARVAALEGTQP